MNVIINFMSKVIHKYLPDTYVLAIIITIIVFFSGLIFTSHGVLDMVDYWGSGFSKLYQFGMQMTLVLIMGFSLAKTPIVKSFIKKLVSLPNSPKQAIFLVALVSIISCYINWAFGLVVGALLAKETAKRHQGAHFPLIVAAAYGGEIIRGPSSSIPLIVATPGHFMEDKIGIISSSTTLFSYWNIGLSFLILIALVVLYTSIKIEPSQIIPYKENSTDLHNEDISHSNNNESFADKIENCSWTNRIFALFPLLYLIGLIITGKFSINLNVIILTFLCLTLLLSQSVTQLLKNVQESVLAARGILFQFPLYAGVAGMMASSGLVDQIAHFFINLSTQNSFPIFTFISAGIVNFFIPSGGGQWAIQGPVIMQAAYELGANPAHTIMAFAWGDSWTNQIQPFWALPLLGVAGLTAKDIMGYCIIWLMISGLLIAGTFFLLSFI